jgi:hypothetical protein
VPGIDERRVRGGSRFVERPRRIDVGVERDRHDVNT